MELHCHNVSMCLIRITAMRIAHPAGSYEMKALCPDCHQPLQVLKACGAVDYFRQHDMA